MTDVTSKFKTSKFKAIARRHFLPQRTFCLKASRNLDSFQLKQREKENNQKNLNLAIWLTVLYPVGYYKYG